MTAEHGLFAASQALGHQNIKTTADYYADRRDRATVNLGHVFRNAENVISLPGSSAQEAPSISKQARKSK
jgi:hypothetical protein